MTVEENARLEASIADAISVQQQFFQNQFTEANDHSEKVCWRKIRVLGQSIKLSDFLIMDRSRNNRLRNIRLRNNRGIDCIISCFILVNAFV